MTGPCRGLDRGPAQRRRSGDPRTAPVAGLTEPNHELSTLRTGVADRHSAIELLTTIAHLREVLGDKTYESFARKGEAVSMAAIAAYAYDQIDQARTELERLR